MHTTEQFGVFVFHEETGGGVPLKRADSSEECSTFRNSAEALREMDERRIDYGIRTEIVDLDSNKVVLQTTDEGQTWDVPTKRERLDIPAPA
jgi:hypothetical protein